MTECEPSALTGFPRPNMASISKLSPNHQVCCLSARFTYCDSDLR
jgi:hypothetical protein